MLTSVFCDYIAAAARKKKFDWSDASPIMSGLLLALLMPASLPYTVMVFASAFMSLICKNAFGGNKNLIFCPVCVSYIFTTFCFPSYVLRYPVPTPFGKVPVANTVAESLTHSYTFDLDNGTSSAFSLLDLIWGKLSGPMGSSAVLIIFICGVALYFFGDIPAPVFFAGFGANVLINVMYPVGEPGWYAVLNSLVAGSYLFTLVFMACDLRYVPRRIFSQIVYGAIFALGSYYVRTYTSIENSSVFVLPLLCVFRDEFDRLTDLLERLLRFLWKKFKILLGKLRSGLAWMIDRLSEFIAKKLREAEKKRELKYGSAKKAEKKEEEEPLKLTVSEIVIVDEGTADAPAEEPADEVRTEEPAEAAQEEPAEAAQEEPAEETSDESSADESSADPADGSIGEPEKNPEEGEAEESDG